MEETHFPFGFAIINICTVTALPIQGRSIVAHKDEIISMDTISIIHRKLRLFMTVALLSPLRS